MKRIFYEYHISKKYIFVAPVPIVYGSDPQVFIKIMNIEPLHKLYIGTSGYSYSWWKEFYHIKSKSKDQFAIYVDYFLVYKSMVPSIDNATQKHGKIKVNRSITHYYQFQKFDKIIF